MSRYRPPSLLLLPRFRPTLTALVVVPRDRDRPPSLSRSVQRVELDRLPRDLDVDLAELDGFLHQ